MSNEQKKKKRKVENQCISPLYIKQGCAINKNVSKKREKKIQ